MICSSGQQLRRCGHNFWDTARAARNTARPASRAPSRFQGTETLARPRLRHLRGIFTGGSSTPRETSSAYTVPVKPKVANLVTALVATANASIHADGVFRASATLAARVVSRGVKVSTVAKAAREALDANKAAVAKGEVDVKGDKILPLEGVLYVSPAMVGFHVRTGAILSLAGELPILDANGERVTGRTIQGLISRLKQPAVDVIISTSHTQGDAYAELVAATTRKAAAKAEQDAEQDAEQAVPASALLAVAAQRLNEASAAGITAGDAPALNAIAERVASMLATVKTVATVA